MLVLRDPVSRRIAGAGGTRGQAPGSGPVQDPTAGLADLKGSAFALARSGRRRQRHEAARAHPFADRGDRAAVALACPLVGQRPATVDALGQARARRDESGQAVEIETELLESRARLRAL